MAANHDSAVDCVELVAGVDEAGRGLLADDVVAAAVIIDQRFGDMHLELRRDASRAAAQAVSRLLLEN